MHSCSIQSFNNVARMLLARRFQTYTLEKSVSDKQIDMKSEHRQNVTLYVWHTWKIFIFPTFAIFTSTCSVHLGSNNLCLFVLCSFFRAFCMHLDKLHCTALSIFLFGFVFWCLLVPMPSNLLPSNFLQFYTWTFKWALERWNVHTHTPPQHECAAPLSVFSFALSDLRGSLYNVHSPIYSQWVFDSSPFVFFSSSS